jgi:hypothetical protein
MQHACALYSYHYERIVHNAGTNMARYVASNDLVDWGTRQVLVGAAKRCPDADGRILRSAKRAAVRGRGGCEIGSHSCLTKGLHNPRNPPLRAQRSAEHSKAQHNGDECK